MDLKRVKVWAPGLLLLPAFIFFITLFMPVSSSGVWKEVRIPEGATYREGISILIKEEIIKSEIIFLLLGRLTMMDRHIKAGYYNLSASMNPWEIFDTLIKGRIVQYAITIPAGLTLEKMKLKFRDSGLIDDESWQLVYDRDFLKSLNIDAPSLEGYIYPETYNFSKGMKPENILRTMVKKMKNRFDEPLRRRAAEIGLSENEVLTLASIIEREAFFDRERATISAVYHNRIKRGMKLQADPTVLYGVSKKDKRIRYRDLRRETPYNTYKISGLPPGPIASPGIKSIRAALYPSDGDYIYFVSKNDGSHHFSRTGREHIEAVNLYQRNGNNSRDSDNQIPVMNIDNNEEKTPN